MKRLIENCIFLTSVLFLVEAQVFAQEPNMKKVISPEAFYKSALKDKAKITSFTEVKAGLAQKTIVLVDLRDPREFHQYHVKGAINIPATELTDEHLAKVIPSAQAKIVLYCANNFDLLSRRVPLTTLAYPTFRQLGYQDVAVMDSVPKQPLKDFPLALAGDNIPQ